MDLVDYDRDIFDAIVADYREFAAAIGIEAFAAIPVSGLNGDNIAARSAKMPWYDGPSLIEHLESVPIDARCRCRQAAPDAGAMGQPARPGFPRLRRDDRRRHGAAGRRGADRAVGPDQHGRADRDDGRRPRRSRRRPVGHAGPGRRGRLLARRRDRGRRRPARSRRPVRSDDRVDGRGRASPGARLLAQARRPRPSPRRSTRPNIRSTSTASSISRRRRSS